MKQDNVSEGLPVWRLNTKNENLQLMLELLRQKDVDRVIAAFNNDEAPRLDAFFLDYMAVWGYSNDEISKIINSVKKCPFYRVGKWVREYFPHETALGIISGNSEMWTDDFPTNEDCIQLQLWDALYSRQQYALLYQHAPWFLEQNRNPETDAALLRLDFEKYAPLFFAEGESTYGTFLAVENGWKYLLKKEGEAHNVKAVEYVLNNMKVLKDRASQDEVLEAVYDAGYSLLIYKKEYYDFLLKKNRYTEFIDARSEYQPFWEAAPECINWDYHWKNKKLRKRLLVTAWKHRDKNVLISRFFWKHAWRLWDFL